jgi:RND family efflux transporter MFP subunit
MPSLKKLLPFLIIVASVGIAISLVKSRAPAQQVDIVQRSIFVDVMPLHRQDAFITVASQGTIEPRTRTNLVAEVAGRVISVSPAFVVGGFFREGEVLLRLDDQNHRAAVSRNQAAVAAARSQLEQERGQADVARREWDRMTPERQAQVRAKELYLREPQLQEAQARLESAEADLAQSLYDLARTTIIAPYDGLVAEKNTDLGQFVTTGASLAQTFAVDYAEVRLPIPENKIQFLDLPQLVRWGSNETIKGPEVALIARLGDEEQIWNGRLTRTEGVLDTRSRVLFSVVQIEDPYGLYGGNKSGNGKGQPLRIGTYVNASIKGQQLHDVYVLPRHTLQAGDLVWVADNESRLRSRRVQVVTINGDEVFIRDGFESGDRVVFTRLENPLSGISVDINELPVQAIN